MRPSDVLDSNREAIRHVVATHHASNARIFGSVLHGCDHDDSDLDILIDPTPDTSLMDVAAIQIELQQLLGVSVDVLTPMALPEAFRHRVLSEAVPV
ncbi:nucleotidyltransferase domain-containing protein [Burkholderiaceae bacterium DAT-1]|nr:nucleotidyltransferase domain-containing protein [Burkholderiaceae bacterium DAT-1]